MSTFEDRVDRLAAVIGEARAHLVSLLRTDTGRDTAFVIAISLATVRFETLTEAWQIVAGTPWGEPTPTAASVAEPTVDKTMEMPPGIVFVAGKFDVGQGHLHRDDCRIIATSSRWTKRPDKMTFVMSNAVPCRVCKPGYDMMAVLAYVE